MGSTHYEECIGAKKHLVLGWLSHPILLHRSGCKSTVTWATVCEPVHTPRPRRIYWRGRRFHDAEDDGEADMLLCRSPVLADRVNWSRRASSVAIGGIADIQQIYWAFWFDAIDPQPTSRLDSE
jgi:hypothetical protein